MKTMKKILAVALTLMMVMALATTAFAAEDTPEYWVSLLGAQPGHTYSAYQIFSGDLHEDTLSNIVWGSGVSSAGQTALGDAEAKAESITTQAQAEAFAAEVAPYLGTAEASVTIAAQQNTGMFTGLPAGYYLIETSDTTATNGVKTYYIMKLLKNTTVTIKADVPEVEKTVDDNDANIGDTVTFTLTATMPSKLMGYETYKVVFHDTLSSGLDFVENSVTVTVAGVDKTSAFTTTENNGTLTISCDDVLALGATISSEIVVTYTAKLDADAVIGPDGNSNKVYLEYSNDPNWDGNSTEPTGTTPEVEVKVTTWSIPVFKYTTGEGNTKNALAGAGFTLYDGETVVKLTKMDNNVYKVDPNGTVTEIVTDDTGRFEIQGLEKGTYVLKETTVPAGYNKCEDITVTITESGRLSYGGELVGTVEVLNNAGSTLPETGGVGTTLFYVFGAILMLGAAVLLITKKRMNTAE